MILVWKGPCIACDFTHPACYLAHLVQGFQGIDVNVVLTKQLRKGGNEWGKSQEGEGSKVGGLASVSLWGLAECGYEKPHKTIQHGPGILTRQLERFFFL